MEKRTAFVIAILFGVSTFAAQAHGTGGHDKKPKQGAAQVGDTAFGRAGDPKKVTRTIRVEMADTMRFSPDQLTVKAGDTVKFVVRNSGKVLHEMVLGTEKELQEHAELMRKFPEMEHSEPYMTHVKPGGEEHMVWQFTKPGEFRFGCLIPGHFEAGMKGRIKVVAK